MVKIQIYRENQLTVADKPEAVFSQQEDGFILILVLIMLLILSVLGATVLTSTTSEVRVAANFRTTQEAFNNADGTVQFLVSNLSTYTSGLNVIGNARVDTINSPATGNPIATLTTTYAAEIPGGFVGNSQGNTGYEYTVTVQGTGANNAQIEVEASLVKMKYDSEGNTFYQN